MTKRMQTRMEESEKHMEMLPKTLPRNPK